MKPVYCIIVAFATLIMCGDLHAQQRRVFGQGRILQRLKNDIFGTPTPKYQPQRKPNSKTAKGRTPTPAKPKSTAEKTQNNKQLFQPNAVAGNGKTPPRGNPLETKRFGSGTDFGMSIDENKSGDLVVTRVHPTGNAAKAGVRQGDLVLEAGGAEITSPEELKSIIEILKQGDQLEFKIKNRAGKSQDILIAYGTEPELDAEEVSSTAPTAPAPKSSGMRSVLDQQRAQANYRSQPPTNRKYDRANTYTENERQRKIMELQRQLQQLQQQPSQPIAGPDVNGPGR